MKLSTKLLVMALAMTTINSYQLKAMYAKFNPLFPVLLHIAQPGQLLPEISRQIYANLINLNYSDDDIIRMYFARVENIARQLQKNKNDPEEVLSMIEGLRKIHGAGEGTISALLLKAGLKLAKMSLCDITNWSGGYNCLQLICNGTVSSEHTFDHVKIILDAGDKQSNCDLITHTDWWEVQSAWQAAHYNKNIHTLLTNWVQENKITIEEPITSGGYGEYLGRSLPGRY